MLMTEGHVDVYQLQRLDYNNSQQRPDGYFATMSIRMVFYGLYFTNIIEIKVEQHLKLIKT